MDTQLEIEYGDSRDILEAHEFYDIVQSFATWLCLTQNKIISPVTLYIHLISNKQLQAEFCKSCEITFYEATQKLCFMFPVIGKSKKIINHIKKSKEESGS